MRKATKLVVTILLILLISSMALMFSGCDIFNKEQNKNLDDEPEVKPVYEIKLYDDNWVELEKDGYRTYKNYEVEYDGTRKGVNAKCFIDGELFYTFYYKTANLEYVSSEIRPILIYYDKYSDNSGEKFGLPIEKGQYSLEYEFDVFIREGYAITVSGRHVNYRDLPSEEVRVRLIIK